MDDSFDRGIAFIVEGDTEKEFYLTLLAFLCQKHGASLERHVISNEPDIVYKVVYGTKCLLVKFNVVGAITQIPQSGRWFNTQCVSKHGSKLNWAVFLCYDKDDYKEDVSKFHEGDWATLRTSLKRTTAIIDIAAAADIEDVMLQDLEGVCSYVGCAVPATTIRGRKGKAKMKKLFRDNGQTYHEGKRAKALIDSLNMQTIIDSGIVPLSDIDHSIFG